MRKCEINEVLHRAPCTYSETSLDGENRVHNSQVSANRQGELKYPTPQVAKAVYSRISVSGREPISSSRKRLVLQRTERPQVLAFGLIKTMRWGIKGARVRNLNFYYHAILACVEKGGF